MFFQIFLFLLLQMGKNIFLQNRTAAECIFAGKDIQKAFKALRHSSGNALRNCGSNLRQCREARAGAEHITCSAFFHESGRQGTDCRDVFYGNCAVVPVDPSNFIFSALVDIPNDRLVHISKDNMISRLFQQHADYTTPELPCSDQYSFFHKHPPCTP